MTDRRCGTCRHYLPARNPDTGRVLPSQAGECRYEVQWPVLPMCYSSTYASPQLPRRSDVWTYSWAERCQMWETIPEKTKKKPLAEVRQETML